MENPDDDFKSWLAKAFGRPIYLYHLKEPGWSGPLPIYRLWCPACKTFTETHPAGYGRIQCRTCPYRKRVRTWQSFRDKGIASFWFFTPRILLLPSLLLLIVLLVSKCPHQ